MKKMMQDARNRFLALRERSGSAAVRGNGSGRIPRKLIVVTSMVLLVAIFSSVLMLGAVPGGQIKAMAGSGSLTSVSGNNIIPGQYSPVNVPAGTYIMTKENYGKVAQSSDGLAVFDFHIFAEKFASTAHTCGNIAVKVLGQSVLGTSGAPEFGSRAEHDTDSIKLSYVGELHGWSAATKVENQVFGPKVQIEGDINKQVFVVDAKGTSHMMGNDNNGNMLNNIYIDTGAPEYININEELKEAENYMRWLVWLMDQVDETKTTTTVSAANMKDQSVVRLTYNDILYGGGMGMGFFGWGGTTIDLSKYDAETVIIDLGSYKDFWGKNVSEATSLISGSVKLTGTTGKRVIFNVDTTGLGKELTFFDTNMTADKLTNSEDSANKDNNILWNFYERDPQGVPVSYKGKITVGGTWMGTINAPEAKVFCRAGLNGSIIAKEVATTAETHKSDYTGERVARTTVDLTVTKIWEDDPSMRPEFITLQLLRDGKVISTVQVSENNSDSTIADTAYNWYYTFKDLPATDDAGNTYQYKVQELAVPGYETSQVNNTIVNTSTNEEIIAITYELTVAKTDGSAPLAGAVLRLTGANLSAATVYDANGNEITNSVTKTDKEIIWTSTGSAVTFKDLSAGNYTVSEVTAPDGYKLAADQSFALTSNKTIEVVNTPIEVTFNKLNGQNTSYKSFLSGAKFELTPNWGNSLSGVTVIGATIDSRSDSKIAFTTGTSGISFKGIAAGSYTLTETSAPEGYQTSAPITFIIDANGNVTINGNTADAVEVYNYLKPAEPKYYSLDVSKTGEGVNGYLSGAQLQLIAVDKNADFSKVAGGTVDTANKTVTWTTTGSVTQITGLPEGSYTLTELKAPDGYKKAADVSVTLNGDNTAAREATMHDELIKLNIAKTDSISGAYVAGAQLTLTGDNGYSKSFNTTGALIELSGLPAGTYTLSESVAPAGYTKSNVSQVFVVDEWGKVTNSSNANISDITVTMKNEPTQISIIKQFWRDKDGDGNVDSDETGFLAGASLTLTGSVDLSNVTGSTTVQHVDENTISWTSGSAANVLRGLPDGSYTLTETAAPDGYDVAQSVTFTVSGGKVTNHQTTNVGDSKTDTSVTLTNEKVTYYPLQVHKVDKDNTDKYLAGATLAIFKAGTAEPLTADKAIVVFETTGDKNNPNEFRLPNGKYILAELAAPEGYDLSTERVEFTLSGGNVGDVNVSGGSTEDDTTGGDDTGDNSGSDQPEGGDTVLPSGQFVLGSLGNLDDSQYSYCAGRVTADITELVKAHGKPATITYKAEKESIDAGYLNASNPFKTRIAASNDGSTIQYLDWGDAGISLNSTYNLNLQNTVTDDSIKEYNNCYLTFLIEAQGSTLQNMQMTEEQFAEFGISATVTFSDGHSALITSASASAASAYEIASGATSSTFTHGYPAGITDFKTIWDNVSYLQGTAYIDVTDHIAPGGVLSIPENIVVTYSSDCGAYNAYAAVVDSTGHTIAVERVGSSINGNTITSQMRTGDASNATAPYYFVIGLNANTFFNADNLSGFNLTLAIDGDVVVGDPTTQPSQPETTANGTIYLHVQDNSGNSLDGIEFKLLKDNNEISVNGQSRWTTANGGNITVQGLENGSYRFEQTNTTLTGYNQASGGTATVTDQNTTHNLTYSVGKQLGQISLTLTDGTNPISGAKFKLQRSTDGGANFSDYTVNGTSEWTTGNDGRLTASNLEWGVPYRFVQTYTPDGYNIDNAYTNSVTFDANNLWNSSINVTNSVKAPSTDNIVDIEGGNGEPIVITFANSKTPEENRYLYGLKVNKTNGSSSLSGAVFNLFTANGKLIKVTGSDGAYTMSADGTVINLTTNGSGYITVDGLEIGDYYLYETQAPAGHVLNSERVDITVNKDNTFADGKRAETTVVNEPLTASLVITKLDTQGRPLPGAVFELRSVNTSYGDDRHEDVYDEDGNVSEFFTTGVDGKYTFTGLEANRIYYVVEQSAPAGMQPADTNAKYPVLTNSDTAAEGNAYYNAGNLYGIALGENITAQVLTWTDSNGNGTRDQGELSYTAQTSSCYDGAISITNTPVQTTIAKTDGQNALAGAVLKLEPVRTEGAENVSATTALKAPGLGAVTGTVSTSDVIEFTYSEINGEQVVSGIEYEYLTWTTTDQPNTLYGLPAGKYILSELSAPAGYATAQTMTIEVDANGKINGLDSVTMIDNILTGEITLVKSDAVNGDRIAGAKFDLMYREIGSDAEFVKYNSYQTGDDGVITASGLPWGYEYKFVETAFDGYAYDASSAVYSPETVELTADSLTAEITATNERLTNGELTLIKTDADSGAAISGAEFDLYYRMAGTGLDFQKYNSETLTTDENGTITVENLPWGYEYYFEETKAAEGYDIDSAAFTGGKFATLTAADNTATVYATNKKLTSITVTKVWNDNFNQDGIRPDSITVQLLANGQVVKTQEITGTGDTWSYTWNDLDTIDENGNSIVYTVGEVNIDSNYTASVNGLTITNSYAGGYVPAQTSITITKIWKDDSNRDAIRPTAITVDVLANGTVVMDDHILTEAEATKSADGNTWSWTISGLTQNANGTAIVYTIDEVNVDSRYTASVDGFTVTNTHQPATTRLTVTKEWSDSDNQDGIRPDKVIVKLMADGEEVADKSVELNGTIGWTYTWENLPVYNGTTTPIVYTVVEETVAGYSTTYAPADYTAVAGDTGAIEITNSHTPGVSEVTVNKVWKDNNDQDGIRPDTITVQLKNGETVVDTAVLSETNNWSHTWTGLALKANGALITYTVDEAEVPEGYTKSVTGYTITNTHATATTEYTVNKVWVDNDDQDGIRPDAVTVQLMNGTTVVDTAVLSESNNWSHTWTGLALKANGAAITYTVDEADVPAGYTKSVEGGTITNTHTTDTTEYTVTKVWADNDDQDGIRPDTVTVQLMNGTTVVDTAVLSETNNWSHTWTGLALKANGEVITYTVDEAEVPEGYTKSVEGGTITNTHTTDTTEYTVTKVWADNDDQDDIRPESVTVQLMNGTTVVDTAVLSESNNWSHTWTGLALKANGEEITYTVDEAEVPAGYTKSVEGGTITNTHTPSTVEVSVTKNWYNGSFTGSTPSSVTVQLLCNGVEVEGKTLTLNADNSWSGEWTDLPEFSGDADKPNAYTVKELNVPGYTSAVTGSMADGFVITNSRIANGQITLIKTDAANNALPVAGAEFELLYRVANSDDEFASYMVNGSKWIGTTDSEGKIVVTGLCWGYEYKFVETKAAAGYGSTLGYAADETVTLTANDMGQNIDFRVTNERITASAIFTKTDAATSEPLAGATLIITNTDGISLEGVTGVTGTDNKAVTDMDDNAASFTWISGESAVALSGLPAGSYTMTEITAPYGYEIAEEIRFVIGDDSKVYTYNASGELVEASLNKVFMEDKPVTTNISKKAVGGGSELAGAQLTVTLLAPEDSNATLAGTRGTIAVTYDAVTNSVTWTSGTTENTLSVLPDGIYSLTEVSAPEGFELAETMYFKVDGGKVYNTTSYAGNDTVWSETAVDRIVMRDAYSTGSATISKQAVGGGNELVGAELTVTLIAPEAADATLKDVTGTSEITRSTDNKSVTWTSGSTANTLTALPDGIYSLTEVTVPNGYKVAETMYFKVDNGVVYSVTKDGETYTTGSAVTENTVVMFDAPVEATISKQEVGGGDELPGAELTVTLVTPAKDGSTLENVTGSIEVEYDENTNSVTWVSGDEANTLTALPDGIYTLTEVTEPDGYKVAETMYFKVENGVVYNTDKFDGEDTEWDEADDETVVMFDAPTTATISKQEVGGGDELPGAELTVTLVTPENKGATLENVTGTINVKYDEKTNSVTWVSGDEANTLSRLPDGVYTLTEVTAPAGYKVAETMYFKVEDGVVYNAGEYKEEDTKWDEADDETVVMFDAPTTATISKRAVGAGSELAGAKLTVKLIEAEVKGSTLENTTGTIKVDYDKKTNSISWTSGDKANTLSVLPDGIYSLTEVTAPAGYEIAETIYFKVDNSVVYNTADYKEDKTEWKAVDDETIIMYDALSPADGTASFVKKSDLGTSLAGAVFTLKDSEGKTKTATSNANGIVSFTGLDAGQYELTETSAPTGYTKSSQKVIVKVADDGTVSWFTTNGDGIPVASVEVLFTNTYIIKPGTTPEKPVVGGKIDLSDNLDTALKDLDVEWSSSNPDIAEVDKNGVVTVKKPGNFTITVTHNGKPVQNFVLGATDTTNSGSNSNTNGTTGTAPSTGNDLVQFGVTASAVLLGGLALMSAVVYGYKRKKSGTSAKK